MTRLPRSLLLLYLASLAGCSSSSPPAGATDAAGSASRSDAADAADAKMPVSPVNCAMACRRAARCAEALVTEKDCLALCTGDADPATYACCIQYASGCATVKNCVQNVGRACNASGAPWVAKPAFATCECGDPTLPNYKLEECKASAVDHPCETGLCYKPNNSADLAFCTWDCTTAPKTTCPAGTHCVDAPRTWYCDRD